MNREKARNIAKAIKKRFRSSEGEVSATKKHKDLLEGDLDDFLTLLENFDCQQHQNEADMPSKQEVETNVAMNNSVNKPSMEASQNISLHELKDPKVQSDLLIIFGPLFAKLNDSFSKKVENFHIELAKRDEKIKELESKVEQLEYSTKQNNLTLHGLQTDKEGEDDTTKNVIEFARKNLKVEIKESDIVDSFRIGDSDSTSKPILVKFKNQTIKNKVYKAKKLLKKVEPKYYVNEDLTKAKVDLYKKVKKLRSDLYIWKCWTFNSKIFYTIKDDKDEEPKQITCEDDILTIRNTVRPRIPPRPRRDN